MPCTRLPCTGYADEPEGWGARWAARWAKPVVPESSFYGQLAQWSEQLVRDEDFAEMYTGTSRPSNSPALLAKVLLLMYHDDVSDREAEKRARYDLRWKHALGLDLDEQAGVFCCRDIADTATGVTKIV
ncbi:MAG: transposase [Candidatus Desulforudis sp.]|nr:transposase [Desulforudis sp.]